ncbi:ABC transporter substrate-binding protein [Paenibacillus sp. UNC451MF]|uniref:ABC transporter substrate-binding protein n=1 Tax=Paenibacillus sp. UNC451MF TaxID=1449063 RepID=UPI00048A7629|nr:extracellular solute-binding protein [Paenibacillus sp. UNC451MF]
MKKGMFVAVVAMTTALAVLAAGCGGGAEEGGSKPSVDKPAGGGANFKNDPVDLTFYLTSNNISEEKFMEQYGNKIKEKLPHINVKYIMQKDSKSLPELLTAGGSFDIMISSVGLTQNFLTTYDLQYDISELIKKYNFDLNKLEPTSVEIQRGFADGGIYGMPVSTTSGALFYNKDLFDKFGVPYPKDGMTWDEVYELAKKMTRTEGGIKYKGLAMSFQHLMLLDQNSFNPLDPKTFKPRITEDGFKQSFENLARFFKIPGNEVEGDKYTLASQTDQFLKNGTAAMYLSLSGTRPENFNWDIVSHPVYKDKPGIGPQSYPTYFYITKTSKNKDAAFQVLDYIASEDFQRFMVKAGTANTILKDGAKFASDFGIDDPKLKGKNFKSLFPQKYAAPTIKTKYQGLLETELYTALMEYQKGSDANTVLRAAAERADKAIQSEIKK